MATILIVDDEPSLRRLLCATLEHAGHTVQEAADGHQALLRVSGQPPDLILLDIALPGLNGIEVSRRLRAIPATNRTPVLLMSGALSPEETAKLFEAGASGLLAKPFAPVALLERLEALLGASAALSGR